MLQTNILIGKKTPQNREGEGVWSVLHADWAVSTSFLLSPLQPVTDDTAPVAEDQGDKAWGTYSPQAKLVQHNGCPKPPPPPPFSTHQSLQHLTILTHSWCLDLTLYLAVFPGIFSMLSLSASVFFPYMYAKNIFYSDLSALSDWVPCFGGWTCEKRRMWNLW